MLSYQHAFHAGNHADLLKHYVLSFVLNSLNKKDKPYTFFDTHSGSGLYDLYDNRNLKTKEAEKGIITLLSKNNIPPELNDYLNVIKNFSNKNYYPGSPLIENFLMRKDDIQILSELHPQEIQNLEKSIKNYKSDLQIQNLAEHEIQVHNRNGFEMIKALTPPKTKRGGVLIDPSYEEKKDYDDCTKAICAINKKWSNGIILLWYPLLLHRETEINNMISAIINSANVVNQNTEILNLQLCVNNKNSHLETSLENLNSNNPPRLYGSGMLVINAPWKLKEESEIVISYLEKILKQN